MSGQVKQVPLHKLERLRESRPFRKLAAVHATAVALPEASRMPGYFEYVDAAALLESGLALCAPTAAVQQLVAGPKQDTAGAVRALWAADFQSLVVAAAQHESICAVPVVRLRALRLPRAQRALSLHPAQHRIL